MLLDEMRRTGVPDDELPLAYLCVLDNHPKKIYAQAHLERRFATLPHDPRVTLLLHAAPVGHRPAFTDTARTSLRRDRAERGR